MRVLAVGAHAGDLELLCGGTLLRYVEAGHSITMCVAAEEEGTAAPTSAVPGSLHAEPREREARESAALLGADLIWLGFREGLLFHDASTRLAMADAIRRAGPEVIITHSPNDYHPDHRVASEIVLAASFLAAQVGLETEHSALDRVASVFYMDTLTGRGFQPEVYVDIGETFEAKRELLARHASRREWPEEHNATGATELIEKLSRARGVQAGVTFAEAFRVEPSWPGDAARRLLP